MLTTPAALRCCQKTAWQLGSLCAVCRLFCCKAEDARLVERGFRTRRNTLVLYSGVAVFGSEASTAAAVGSKRWGKEVCRPAATHLARGKKGGGPTAAYSEDPIGFTAEVQARLQGGGRKPPPVSRPSPIWRRKETGSERKAAEVPGAALVSGDAPPGGCGGQGTPHPQGGGGHSKSQSGKFITSREGTKICFTSAQSGRDARQEPRRSRRAHSSQLCLGSHRNNR